MIRIVAVGKVSQKHVEEGIAYYTKQLGQTIEIIEIKDGKTKTDVAVEGQHILTKLKPNDYVIALAIEGKMVDSVGFSQVLEQGLTYHQGNVVLVIGGSYGLDEQVLKRADLILSFSKMTFPHQLMRLILVEQIYRGLMILKNHPYHK